MVVLSLGHLSLSLSLSPLSLSMCVCACTCMYVSIVYYVCTQVLTLTINAHTQGDSSASENADSVPVDERARLILDTQDPKINCWSTSEQLW